MFACTRTRFATARALASSLSLAWRPPRTPTRIGECATPPAAPAVAVATPVRCGDTLRLTHLATGKNLHSHLYSSPITQEQEVSAYGDAKGEGDRGDDWTVVCDTSGGGGGGLWLRSQRVRLRHSVTERYLHVAGARFGRPIAGQAEVSAVASGGGRGSYWLAAEGVFVKPNEASESPGMGRAPSVERPAFVVSGDGADGGGLHDSGEL
uniref:MIR domain-containing protein n=1 Tax=Macrostomum lignano TaxID=282301 RepID=A0A1I8ISA4_9PLAT